jgi:hypothetical protein
MSGALFLANERISSASKARVDVLDAQLFYL